MHLEIYAANLRVGGALYRCADFMHTLRHIWDTRRPTWIHQLDVIVSPAVAQIMQNREPIRLGRSANAYWEVRLDNAIPGLRSIPTRMPDLRYVFRGPDYQPRTAGKQILGFADGTVVQPHITDRRAQTNDSVLSRTAGPIRNAYKRRRLNNFDAYIVQTASMRAALSNLVGPKPVAVIPNTLPMEFLEPNPHNRRDLPLNDSKAVRLFYPANGYAHKNHQFIPHVIQRFNTLFGRSLQVFVTLSKTDYRKIFGDQASGIYNLGPVSIGELANIYRETDGLFFPSYIETFSAAPLEAAFLKKPIFAPQLDYVMSLFGSHAFTYSVDDALHAAQVIGDVTLSELNNPNSLNAMKVRDARVWAEAFADPVGSTEAHLAQLRSWSIGWAVT